MPTDSDVPSPQMKYVNKICGARAPKSQGGLKRLLPDDSTGALWLEKRVSLKLNLNFSFINRISLLLISSSYPIILTGLDGPRFRPYTSRSISRISWLSVRRANHRRQCYVLFENFIISRYVFSQRKSADLKFDCRKNRRYGVMAYTGPFRALFV